MLPKLTYKSFHIGPASDMYKAPQAAGAPWAGNAALITSVWGTYTAFDSS